MIVFLPISKVYKISNSHGEVIYILLQVKPYLCCWAKSEFNLFHMWVKHLWHSLCRPPT